MGYARDPLPLPPILLDADWRLDLGCYGANVATPLPLPYGASFSAVFSPAGYRKPLAQRVHELTSAAGDIILLEDHVLRIAGTVADGTWDDWEAIAYDLEVRATLTGGQVEPLYVARVDSVRGLSQVAAQGGGSTVGFPYGQYARRNITLDGVVRAATGLTPWPDADPSLDFTNPDNFALGLITGVL